MVKLSLIQRNQTLAEHELGTAPAPACFPPIIISYFDFQIFRTIIEHIYGWIKSGDFTQERFVSESETKYFYFGSNN